MSRKQKKSKVEKDLMEFQGEIVDILPNQMFKVRLENDHVLTAYTGGKMRQFKIRMVMGDKVMVEVSPYDLAKGRITYRMQPFHLTIKLVSAIIYTIATGVLMIINVKGGKASQKKYIKSIVQFCQKMLMPRMNSLEITVVLKDLSKSNVYGYCTSDPEGDADRLDRPRSFEIEIHSKMKLRRTLETICHEMVHVKQYAQGELYQSGVSAKHRWQGSWLDKDPEYWDQPWEIEAHGRETGLFVRWAESEELGKRKWTQED